FSYSGLSVTPSGDGFDVKVTVTNNGKVAGKESVQIYVSAPKGRLLKAEKELKAFAKTALLEPGKSQTLSMHISNYDLSAWDSREEAWVADKGTYTVSAGASSKDIRLTGTYELR
ncbi:MAG: fibronectin type III-like domain-contianing protein, partial [Bacteroidales bacterium]|nr:fibronectin type III-like domain-contianing protein [Bacteroidales bacterium]